MAVDGQFESEVTEEGKFLVSTFGLSSGTIEIDGEKVGVDVSVASGNIKVKFDVDEDDVDNDIRVLYNIEDIIADAAAKVFDLSDDE